jgi:hypothetical protein
VVAYGISAEDYIEKYGLAEAIRKGGIGATSKVLKLGEEGKRGNQAIFTVDKEEKSYTLKPLINITEALKSYIGRK